MGEPKRGFDQMKRTMEWVEGTPYVWFNGFDEAYVVNVDEKKVTNTLLGINVSAMLTVRNQEREIATMIAMEQMALAMANVNTVSTSDDMTMNEEDDNGDAYDDDYDDDNFDDDDAYEEKEAFGDDDWFDDDDNDDGNADVIFINEDGTFDNNDNTYTSTNDNSKMGRSINIDPISLSALIIGIIAIAIGIANLLYFNNLKKKFQMSTMNAPLVGTLSLDDKDIA